MGPSVLAGFAGSRSGALIATAWVSMVHMGEAGYLEATAKIMQVSLRRVYSADAHDSDAPHGDQIAKLRRC